MAPARNTATVIGLAVALAGPPLIAAAFSRLLDGYSPVARNSTGQAALWLVAALVVFILLRRERQSLSSVGLHNPTWLTLAAGLAGATLLLYVATPIGLWVVAHLGLSGLERGIELLRQLPLPSLLLAAVTAGVVEEFLYRGYAIERLGALLGSRIAAAALTLGAFALGHHAFWGPASVVFTAVAGVFLTALYLWRRDLCANMLAHGLTAVVQLWQVTSEAAP